VVTTYSNEPFSLYRNNNDGTFTDVSTPVGIGSATLPLVGCAIALAASANKLTNNLILDDPGVFARLAVAETSSRTFQLSARHARPHRTLLLCAA